MRNVLIILTLVAVLLGVGFALAQTNDVGEKPLGSIETSQEAPAPAGLDLPLEKSVNLDGHWGAQLDNDLTVLTTIKNDVIKISFTTPRGTMIYWCGTFVMTAGKESVLSTKIDINKAVLSGADEKTFTFDNANIWFDFEMMGQTRSIQLSRI